MSNEDDNNDPKIYIFPQLKELSKKLRGVDKKCGIGFTNENCVADYKCLDEEFSSIMSHSSSDNTGVFYTWYHAYDFYYSSGGKWPWQAATPSNLSTSNYSNWNKTSTVDTFLINDNHHSGYANPTVLYSESGQNDYVFAQGSIQKVWNNRCL